ncbi:MAG: 16S rRNA (cytosine(1402)-N(4))-methyltransferase RsmH [Candidatus Yonathbacteria bacterium]|nr:16S rRNA (cytosine(1402)-N(4))-methyltransferase RsmH [Candidatus Yonathbacteria bacterium]
MAEHIPVLLQETIAMLNVHPGQTVIDGTLGAGGHSSVLCERLGEKGKLIAFDTDAGAIAVARERLSSCPCHITIINENFRTMDAACARESVQTVDAVLLDLGFSSLQIEVSGRGFSFMRDEPLLMTLTDSVREETLTAREIVNEWGEESIADVIYGYGEERYARRIAKGIVEAREDAPIETTGQLVDIIKGSVPRVYASGKIHPATRTFQALRIAVNDELATAEEGIRKGIALLAPGGRIAVISFHSLEDRIVKRLFKEEEANGRITILTKKPVAPSDEEVKRNPRARSAKLRVAEKMA